MYWVCFQFSRKTKNLFIPHSRKINIPRYRQTPSSSKILLYNECATKDVSIMYILGNQQKNEIIQNVISHKTIILTMFPSLRDTRKAFIAEKHAELLDPSRNFRDIWHVFGKPSCKALLAVGQLIAHNWFPWVQCFGLPNSRCRIFQLIFRRITRLLKISHGEFQTKVKQC